MDTIKTPSRKLQVELSAPILKTRYSKTRMFGSVKGHLPASQALNDMSVSANAIAPAAACSFEHTTATAISVPSPTQCWNNSKTSNLPSSNASVHSYHTGIPVFFRHYDSDTVLLEQPECTMNTKRAHQPLRFRHSHLSCLIERTRAIRETRGKCVSHATQPFCFGHRA